MFLGLDLLKKQIDNFWFFSVLFLFMVFWFLFCWGVVVGFCFFSCCRSESFLSTSTSCLVVWVAGFCFLGLVWVVGWLCGLWLLVFLVGGYVFIMVRSILSFVFAVRAWGLLAGMMVASPCFSWMGLPDMVMVASPSRIWTRAS